MNRYDLKFNKTHMKDSISVSGFTISYEKRVRTDKTILFLHHNSGSAAVWDAQWNDRRLAGYTLVRVDMPGQGASSHSLIPDTDYTLSGLGHVLAEIVDRLELSNYVISALSISTNIAGEAVRQLRGCRGLFMTGSSVIGDGITPEDILLPFQYGAALFEANPGDEELRDYIKGLVNEGQESTIEALVAWYREADQVLRPTLGKSIGAGNWSNEIDNLDASRIPVVLVYGDQEQVIDRGYLEKARPGNWRKHVRVLEKAGHLANLDDPEAFTRLLAGFASETLD